MVATDPYAVWEYIVFVISNYAAVSIFVTLFCARKLMESEGETIYRMPFWVALLVSLVVGNGVVAVVSGSKLRFGVVLLMSGFFVGLAVAEVSRMVSLWKVKGW